MHLSPTTPLTVSMGTACVAFSAVIGLSVWLWQMRWAQERVATDVADLKADVRWIQQHIMDAKP